MKIETTTAAIGFVFALICTAAQAEPAGPAFPGNEAVRIVNGKRVVETPPLTAATKRFVDGGGKTAPSKPSLSCACVVKVSRNIKKSNNFFIFDNVFCMNNVPKLKIIFRLQFTFGKKLKKTLNCTFRFNFFYIIFTSIKK